MPYSLTLNPSYADSHINKQVQNVNYLENYKNTSLAKSWGHWFREALLYTPNRCYSPIEEHMYGNLYIEPINGNLQCTLHAQLRTKEVDKEFNVAISIVCFSYKKTSCRMVSWDCILKSWISDSWKKNCFVDKAYHISTLWSIIYSKFQLYMVYLSHKNYVIILPSSPLIWHCCILKNY